MMFSRFHYISLDYIDKMSGGDEETKKLLLDMLINELPQAVLEMKQLFAAKKWELLRNASHKMKSTLAFVGNDQMTRANRKILETLSSSGNGNSLHQEMKTLEMLGPKVLTELQSVVKRF